eukprot:SAG22_NODE_7_length_40155_cov_25.241356_34_plen_232_part_00
MDPTRPSCPRQRARAEFSRAQHELPRATARELQHADEVRTRRALLACAASRPSAASRLTPRIHTNCTPTPPTRCCALRLQRQAPPHSLLAGLVHTQRRLTCGELASTQAGSPPPETARPTTPVASDSPPRPAPWRTWSRSGTPQQKWAFPVRRTVRRRLCAAREKSGRAPGTCSSSSVTARAQRTTKISAAPPRWAPPRQLPRFRPVQLSSWTPWGGPRRSNGAAAALCRP